MTESSPWGRPDGGAEPSLPAGGWAPPPGPPGAYHYPPPQRAKSRLGLWIGLGVGAVVLILCACTAMVAVPFYYGYTEEERVTVAALEDYLDLLVNEDYAAAYEQLCHEAKAETTQEEFAADAAGEGFVGYEVTNAEMADTADDFGYDIDVRWTFEESSPQTYVYFVYSRDANLDEFFVCPPR